MPSLTLLLPLLAVVGIAVWFVIQRLRPGGLERPKGADVPTLARALSDGNPAVRSKAAAMLGRLGEKAKSTKAALHKVIRDEDGNVALSGAIAVVKVDPSDSSDAVPVLATALKNSDFGIRREAAESLGKIGPTAGQAVPALTAVLKDPNNIIRRVAAESLGRIGRPAAAAAEALSAALEDRDERVRDSARHALARIGRG
jgi:HEAT repeat protein